MSARVVCVGNAVLDYVFHIDALPAAPGKYPARAFTAVGGGPAASAAVTIARLGGVAVLCSRLGQDPSARLIEEELRAFGVDTQHCKRYAKCQSSVSAVLLEPDGERTVINRLDPDLPTASDWLPELPRDTGAVLADTRWPEGALALLQGARERAVPAILDADAPIDIDSPLLSAASHIALSSQGLAQLGDPRDPPALLRALRQRTGAWVGVTQGGEGTLYVTDDGSTQRVPAYAVTPVDTLGAGDVWHGAFALALAEGRDEAVAVAFASAAAALKVSRPGGRQAIPVRAELDDWLRTARTH